MPTRRRKVDQALLNSECLDSDDQELLIEQLHTENEELHILYRKVLAFLVLVELPVLVMLGRKLIPAAKVTVVAFVLLSSLLTLHALLFSGRFRSSNKALDFAFSFNFAATANAVLLIQLLYVVFVRLRVGLTGLFVLVPAGNFITGIFIKKWHFNVRSELGHLSLLKYKLKTA